MPLVSACKEELTAACGRAAGRRETFEAVVKGHMKDAYFIALGLVGNHEDALELSQEAFYRAYRHFDTLNKRDSFFPWFYQILRNLCFSHLRHRKVRQAHELQMDDSVSRIGGSQVNPQSEISNLQSNRDDAFDPGVVVEQNETAGRVWNAIGRLDPKHREVIILRHFRNLSYDEMAGVLFCSRGTVTSRLYYARKRLKEILDLEKGGPP